MVPTFDILKLLMVAVEVVGVATPSSIGSSHQLGSVRGRLFRDPEKVRARRDSAVLSCTVLYVTGEKKESSITFFSLFFSFSLSLFARVCLCVCVYCTCG